MRTATLEARPHDTSLVESRPKLQDHLLDDLLHRIISEVQLSKLVFDLLVEDAQLMLEGIDFST